jgi:hypothetical protein
LEAAAAFSLPASNDPSSGSSSSSNGSSSSRLEQLQQQDLQDLACLALRLYLPRPWRPDLGSLQACQLLARQLPSAARLFVGGCLEGRTPARVLLQSPFFTPAVRAAYQLLAYLAGAGAAEPPGGHRQQQQQQPWQWQKELGGDHAASFASGALGRLAELCSSGELQGLQPEVLELCLPYIANLVQEGLGLCSRPAPAAAAGGDRAGAAGSAAAQELLQHGQQVLLGLLPCLPARELLQHVVPLLRRVLVQDTSAANEPARLLMLQPQLHHHLAQRLPLQLFQELLLPLLLSAALEHQAVSDAPVAAVEAAAGAELQPPQLPPAQHLAAAALETVARLVGHSAPHQPLSAIAVPLAAGRHLLPTAP